MPTNDILQLKLPEQDLSRLSIGSTNPKKLRAWIDDLPPFNLGESAHRLYRLLSELDRIKLDYRKRLPLLEMLLPSVEHISQRLSKHYLNQPLVLPAKAQKVASLTQALQGHLANGYKLVAVQGQAKLPKRDARLNVTLACYRGISTLTNALLRCYQLYFPIPSNLWLEIHQLYALAEQHKLDNKALPLEGSPTVKRAYLQALLLASARPNQLRQQETEQIFNASASWSDCVDIHRDRLRDDLFAVDLNADKPPQYQSQLKEENDHCRFLDTSPLIQQLSRRPEVSDLTLPQGMSPLLVSHLRQAWGSLAERSFRRIEQAGHLEICLGLRAVHYYLCGEQHFQQFLHDGTQQVASHNRFVERSVQKEAMGSDPWGQVFETQATVIGDEIDFSASKGFEGRDDEEPDYASRQVEKINASPGGYCLIWPGDTPFQLRTGELAAVRDGHSEWAIGVIRWVRQISGGSAQFGVEIMAPRAQPCAARLIKKTGDSADYMRALLLPALDAISQPITLLLPTVGFQSGKKVDLQQGAEHTRLLLSRRLSGTASYNLFTYHDETHKTADNNSNNAPQEKGMFDAIWDDL